MVRVADDPDLDVVVAGELGLPDPAMRRSRTPAAVLLDEEFREFGAAATVRDRASVLEMTVRQDPAPRGPRRRPPGRRRRPRDLPDHPARPFPATRLAPAAPTGPVGGVLPPGDDAGGTMTGSLEDCVEVVVTAEDADWLAAFTRALVEDRLVACGHTIPAVRAIYRWDGDVHDDPQVRVGLHTRASLVPEIVSRAEAEHPDDVPCVIALPITDGHPAYLRWIHDETRGGKE
jgi:periplasmic divalent cation tolerance protein